MNRFFYKIGLIDEVTVVSKTRRETIIKRLKGIVDVHIPFQIQEREGKRLYEGDVSDSTFSFRRKKCFFAFDQDSETLVEVSGIIEEDDGRVVLKAWVVGRTSEFLITGTLSGVLFFVISIFSSMDNFRWDTIFLLCGVLLFFLLQRYFNMRRGVWKMTRTVDLELNNIARPENSRQPGTSL